MRGKDLSKVSVIRHFCRIFNTALFALVLCFTSNNVMALSRNCPAGTYAYLSTQCKTCPENCWCPTNGSKTGTGYTDVTCLPGGDIDGYPTGGDIANGSFDLNSCSLKNSLFPASDAGSDSVTDCYIPLHFIYYEGVYTYLHGIDNSIYIDSSIIVKKCYNNSYGNATTCNIPKLPVDDYWAAPNGWHYTGNWCYTARSGNTYYAAPLEVVSNLDPNVVTVRIPSDFADAGYENGSVRVSPCEEVNNYTLSFDANGATGTPGVSSRSCECGGATCQTSAVGAMTKTGYTFGGWNTAADGTGTTYEGSRGYNFCRDNIINHGATIVLYAIWTPNKYTIALNNSDGTGGTTTIYAAYNTGVYTDAALTKEMSTSANPITIPTKTGSIFQGFYSTSSGDGIQYVSSNGFITSAGLNVAKGTAAKQTWYARWAPGNYIISLNKNSGTGGATTLYTTYSTGVYTDSARTMAMSTSENPIAVPIKMGSTFQGFYSTNNSNGTRYISPDGFITYSGLSAAKATASSTQNWYAHWVPNNYTIALNNSGGTGGTTTLYTTYDTGIYIDSARTMAMSLSANPITIPTKTDWTFQGFYSSSGGSGTQYISPNGFITNAGLSVSQGYTTSSQTWYAYWTYDGNIVNLYSNCPGGSNTLVATIGVIQNKYMPETDFNGNRLFRPSCPGYRFLGYWDQASGGNQYYDHTLIIYGDGEGLDTKWDKSTGGNLYAHWEEIPDGFSVDIDTSDNEFAFYISAAGTFKVYWGDGEADTITKNTTAQQRVYHEYDSSGEYTITITGTSLGYNADTTVPVIEFSYDDGDTRALYGSLGTVFPTLSSTSISGAITQPSFSGTFRDNYRITSIPETLFDNINGTPVPHMFDSTFENCDGLVTLPSSLFPVFTNNSISNADYMFHKTFCDSDNLASIPSNLFAGVRGAPAEYMFARTFEDCDSITSVPKGLFDSISGSVARHVFDETFCNSDNLETVPADLLSGLSGTPQPGAFYEMFDSTNVTEFKYSNGTTVRFIPPTFFGNIDVSNYHTDHSLTYTYQGQTYKDRSSWAAGDMFDNTQVLEQCPSGYEEYLTGFEDEYEPKVSCIQSCSGNKMHYNGTNCVDSDFTLTTTATDVAGNPNLTNEFAFNITAAGTWVVDWGDGHVQKIYRPDTADEYNDDEDRPDNTTYRHTYAQPGVYTIKMKGLATDYSGTDNIAAINFNWSGYEDYIASITGSLGAMFPTLAGNNVPSFTEVFADVDNFIGELPSGLFSGVTGCRDYMFQNAFSYGKFTRIPAGLFSGINDEACMSLFEETFHDCTELTDVEQNAFPKLQYCGDRMYTSTFQNAEKLTTIPSDLFENQQGGCMELFENTFDGSGLTSIPSELFANIENTGEAMFDSTFKNTNITEVPSDLFKNLQSTDVGLFMNMFSECDNLTTIPADLFKNLESSTSDNMFNSMFYNDANLKYFKYPNGTTVSYIPSTFFGALEESGYDSSTVSPNTRVATNMFAGTDIDETCSANMEEFNSVFKTEYAPKVSCVPVTAQQVAISYVLNGGTGNAPDDVCTIGETLTLPATPAKTGYNFTGWTLLVTQP